MIALGWANIRPGAALASLSTQLLWFWHWAGGDTDTTAAINTSIALAIPLSVTVPYHDCSYYCNGIVHVVDAAAEKGDFNAIERWHIVAILMQGAHVLFLQLSLLH